MNYAYIFAAEAAAPAAGNGGFLGQWGGMLIYLAVIVVVFYFLLIRPNKKKKQEEEKLKNSLQIGDEILTIGGFYGKIISLKEDSVIIESELDHTKQKLARWGIQQNLTVHETEAEKPIKVKKEKKSKENIPEEEKLDK